MAMSRHYLWAEFPPKPTIENKIVIFADRVKGWQLYPAEEIIDMTPHSGFIVLYSLMHYFEMIGKYITGSEGEGESKKYFKIGFKDVASYLGPGVQDLSEMDLDNIYKKVRSALYHTGLTGHGVVLTGAADNSIEVKNANITINPNKLVVSLHKHFDAYLERLHNPDELELRQNFEKRFDHMI